MNWKGHLAYWTLQWVAPALASGLLLGLLHAGFRERLVRLCAGRAFWPLWAISRPIYAVVLYVLLAYPGSGDNQYFMEFVDAILDGAVPGREIDNGYGPLTFTLLTGCVKLLPGWPNLAILLPTLAGDLACVVAGPRLGRRLLGDEAVPVLRTFLLLTPHLWMQLVLRGQDEPLLVGLLAVAVLCAMQRRMALTGVIVGVGMAIAKPLWAPYGLTIVLAASTAWRPRLRGALVAALVAGAGYAIYFARGGLPERLLQQATKGWAATNPLTLVLRPLPGPTYEIGLVIFALAAFGAAVLVPHLGRRLDDDRRLEVSVLAVHAAALLTIPKFHAEYLIIALPILLVAFLREPWDAWRRAGFAMVVVVGFGAAVYWQQVPGLMPLTQLLIAAIQLLVLREVALALRAPPPRSETAP